MRKKKTREEVLSGIEDLLLWLGEDPTREGLYETPGRFLLSLEERLSGYKKDPAQILSKQFSETAGYSGLVQLRDVKIESICEHHLAPIIGSADLAYIPRNKVVGLSKLARLAEVFAHRLQLQERLTAQIASALWDNLQPKGVAVRIRAKHHCLNHRGIKHSKSFMVTTQFLGEFLDRKDLQEEFLTKL